MLKIWGGCYAAVVTEVLDCKASCLASHSKLVQRKNEAQIKLQRTWSSLLCGKVLNIYKSCKTSVCHPGMQRKPP